MLKDHESFDKNFRVRRPRYPFSIMRNRQRVRYRDCDAHGFTALAGILLFLPAKSRPACSRRANKP